MNETAATPHRENIYREALERIVSGIPAHDDHNGWFVVHTDEVGNELGVEQVDPSAIIGSIVGIANAALADALSVRSETAASTSAPLSATAAPLTKKEREYVERLKERITILAQRKRGSQLRDTQEIDKEIHALEFVVRRLDSRNQGT